MYDHGAIHDIDYTIKNNGGTKSLRTDENALKLMDSIDKMPLRNNVKLYENGTYQKGT